jgi:prepilin-type N-terminal cleavage/methylation domain-containing protein
MKNRKLSFRSNSAYGFSVVELIVALTIMTIIVTVGFAAYTYFQTDYGKIANTEKSESERFDLIKSNIYLNIVSGNIKNYCGNPTQNPPSVASPNCIVMVVKP